MPNLHDLRTLDPKTAAKRLRVALKERTIDLSHGECLDLVARQLGLRDWNVLAARLAEQLPAADKIETPEGWLLTGSNTQSFVGGLDRQETHLGRPAFWLRNASGESGFATLMQSVTGEKFRNKRVRFSGYLRTENVDGSATIWLRADDDHGRYIALNNLEMLKDNGALKGTTGWARREIVLDIPAATESLNFGFYLSGQGEARYAGFDLEIVGSDVPLTRPQETEAPINLDFTAV
jgi:hypothetical protein